MKRSWMEPTYEAARTWAVQPISHPPAGWAHIVRRGIASMPVLAQHQSHASLSPAAGEAFRSELGLLTIVAAMIAEVCQ
jgi:hypothetical protein